MTPAKPLAEVLLGGVAWMMAMRWGVRLIGLLSTVILARLLMPADFGVVAMAMVCVGLVNQLLDFGLEFGLIRNPNAERKHYDTTWTIRLLQMGGVSIVLAAAAPFIASGYDEPRVMPILWVIAFGAFVRAWENIGTIDFRKHLLFDRDFKFNVYIKLGGFLVTIGLAFYLRNYWALVVGSLFNHCVAVGLSYVMSSYRPRFSLEAVGEVFSFSQWMLVRGFANYIFGRGDEIITGKIFGSIGLGYYAMAKNVSSMATAEIVQPASRAFVPGFSQFENEPSRLASAFTRAISGMALVVVPAGLGLSCVAPEVVPILLGHKWLGTIPLLQLVPIAEVVMALHGLAGSLVIVIGRVKLLAAVAWLRALVMLGCVYLGFQFAGLIGVVYGMIASATFSFIVLNSAAISVSELEWGRIIRAVVRPVVAGACMMGAIYWVGALFAFPLLVLLIVKMIVGATVYLSVIGLLWRAFGGTEAIETELLNMVRQKLKLG
ncbi:MAG: lipopolysaccharide biosynthesis protein [Nitrospirales bacterium]|nr:MAG: lipopolysaccharide biosynthesis protein [Nitrospirales bacterium]